MKKLFLILIFSCVILSAQTNNLQIENLLVKYEETVLHLTWDLQSAYADSFVIFYCEAQIPYRHLMDGELNWGMTYDQCWDWQIGTIMYHYFFVEPKHVFPPYTSFIRIGVMACVNGTYSTLFLAPDILNRTPQNPEQVMLGEK